VPARKPPFRRRFPPKRILTSTPSVC